MIKISQKNAINLVDSLPDNFLVVDVGGGFSPFPRADYLIDIIKFEDVKLKFLKNNKNIRFNEERYFQLDICDRKSWPIPDKFFDYAICSHVLEDIRDPLWVCSELSRVSKAGYIEVPSRQWEQKFGIEAKNLSGASHHRWIVDIFDNKIRFTFKYFYTHSKFINKSNQYLTDDNRVLRIEWSDNIDCFENFLASGKEIFEYYLERKIKDDRELNYCYRMAQSSNTLEGYWSYFIYRLKEYKQGSKNITAAYNFFIKKPMKLKTFLKNKYNSFLSGLQEKSDSVEKHDEIFGMPNVVEYHQKLFSEFERENVLNGKTFGFDDFVKNLQSIGEYAVDIGSGAGYFSIKLADKFNKVYGIEPSSKAAKVFSDLYSSDEKYKKISWITSYGEDGIKQLTFNKPVFWFTATVLSHITDDAVKEILSLINEKSLPGSAFIFSEVWGGGGHSHMWHVRDQKWWQYNLPGWDLFFEDYLVYPDKGTYKGIKGIKR